LIGSELVLAGAISFQAADVLAILREMVRRIRDGDSLADGMEISAFGTFLFRRADVSWVRLLLLGALDYYDRAEIPAYQVVPDAAHWTIDVPDLSQQWSASLEPVWKWLADDWTLPVPPTSHVAMNLAALRGSRVTEVSRWEEDYWEAIAGPVSAVTTDDARVVPLGTLLGSENSLSRVLELKVGESIWRAPESGDWTVWKK